MKREKIIIGSRGSSLAMIYADNVKAKLKEVFSLYFLLSEHLLLGASGNVF